MYNPLFTNTYPPTAGMMLLATTDVGVHVRAFGAIVTMRLCVLRA